MFKKSILLKKLNETEHKLGRVVIGVYGLERGVGTTHLSILLAHFNQKWLHRRTIYIEWGQNEIRFLNQNCEDKQFHLKGIDWYTSVKQKEISSIIGRDYECAIIDFGDQFFKGKDELLRCNYKIVVGHHALWKQYRVHQSVEELHEFCNNSWLYIIPYMNEKEINALNTTYDFKFYSFPYEPNPFHLSQKSLHLLQELLGIKKSLL